jgi:hypothetical protein
MDKASEAILTLKPVTFHCKRSAVNLGEDVQRATDEHGFTQMNEAAPLSHPCCICVNPWLRTIS